MQFKNMLKNIVSQWLISLLMRLDSTSEIEMNPIDNTNAYTDYILDEDLTREEAEYVMQKMIVILTLFSARYTNAQAVREMLLKAFDVSVKSLESQRLRMH